MARGSHYWSGGENLGLTFPEGVLALGALEEPDAIVGNEVEDEVKNKKFAKVDKSLYANEEF